MFLGAAVFAFIVTLAAVLALKALRTLLNAPFGKRKETKEKTTRKDTEAKEKKSGEGKEIREEKVEQEPEQEQQEEEVTEETRQRFAASLFEGISESFSAEESTFQIEEKTIADRCVRGSALSYLEYNNRNLAGDDFLGFNLIVESPERMVLTYGGVAVASLTRIERETTAVINGETVTGTMPAFRTNTFPPEMKPGMVVADLERMLEAGEAIKDRGCFPDQVVMQMIGYFTRPDNVSRLKDAVIRKIQAMESVGKTQKRAITQSKTRQYKPS